MGLDMYLYAKVPARPGSAMHDVVEKHLTDQQRKELADPDYGNSAYVSGWSFGDKEPEALFTALTDGGGFVAHEGSPHITIDKADSGYTVQICVGYWRKANAVHAWFVEHAQGGVDECQESDAINPEKLLDLVERCDKVLADHSLADSLLPAQSGFFFGGTDYDDYYFSDLKETRDLIVTVLGNPAVRSRGVTLHYHSSW